jgi:hypothetical protein
MTRYPAFTVRIKGAAVALLTATYFLSSVSLAAGLIEGKLDYRDHPTPYTHAEPYHERDLDSVRREFAPYHERDLDSVGKFEPFQKRDLGTRPPAGVWEVPKL